MRILHTVQFYHPSVGGAQEVVRQISEGLARRSHQVTVATTSLPQRLSGFLNGVRIEEFEISGNAVKGFRGDTKAYQDFLQTGRFDIMMNYAAQQWATDLALPLLRVLPYPKVLAPCGFSGLYDARYAFYFAQLPEFMTRYDHLIFHSDKYRDITFARRNGIAHFRVIPNGASEAEFAGASGNFRERYGIPSDLPLLLTVGSHTGLKGHALVIEAFRRARIGPSTLVIIGNPLGSAGCLLRCCCRARLVELLTLGKKKVLLLNPPRHDVVAAYQAADLFILGSRIECSPLVLFEAMASRTAFVSIACGNAEEIVAWSQGGIIVPTRQHSDGTVTARPDRPASAIEDLLHDDQRRNSMALSGYKAWKKHFTWEKIVLQYEELYQNLTN